jgi:3-oxoacyl-[acyl-carrier protein] reductase
MIDPQLQDKVVLITGANNPMGIGAATARAFAAQGAAVYLTYYRAAEDVSRLGDTNIPGEGMYRLQQTFDADDVLQNIRERGGRAESCEADLSDPEIIPRLLDQAEATFGPVDVLINNAAYCVQDTLIPPDLLKDGDTAPDGFPLQPITLDSHDRHFAVNSRAVALLMAEYARRHARRGARWGRIVNISTDGASGFSGEVSYGASKYALESYSRAAAKEFGRLGITVNIASLGPIQTGWIAPSLEETISRNTPLGRVGYPEDVADVIVLLTSEQARWLTGQTIYVGGGHKMHG